jgi:hypothetical protein
VEDKEMIDSVGPSLKEERVVPGSGGLMSVGEGVEEGVAEELKLSLAGSD